MIMDEKSSISEISDNDGNLLSELNALIAAGELATYSELEKLDKRSESIKSKEAQAQYLSLSAPLREKLLAEEQEETARIAEADQIISELNSLLADNQIDALREKKSLLEEKFNSLGVLPQKNISKFRELQRKASIAIAQHFETLDLARWESYTLKLDICNEVEKMLTKKEAEMPQCATILQQLRKKWKTLGAVPKEKSEEINNRYLEATRALQSRIDSFFTAKHQEKKEALAEKTKLCEEIELLADSTDWKSTSEKIKAMQSQWKSLPGCGKQESELFAKFHTAADRFFSARKAHYEAVEKRFADAADQRKALIEQAKSLDIHNFKAAKELREKFRNAPHAGREEENFRKLFDSAMEEFFNRRKEFFNQIDSEYKNLCAELEKSAQNPLEVPEKSAEIISKLRSEQFKHYSGDIEKAIRKFEARRDAAKKSLRLEQFARQKKLLADLIKIYLDFKAGKPAELPQALPADDDLPKVKNFRSLLEKTLSGDDTAGQKIEKMLAESNLEAEKIVEELEKIAGISRESKTLDLAAELQAAILGNSGVNIQNANARSKAQKDALISDFDANILISDRSLIERFRKVCELLKK